MRLSAFKFSRHAHFSRRTGLFFLALVVLFCPLVLLSLTLSTAHAQNHGCAPATPPPVPDTVPAPATPGTVLINEVLSRPASTWNCSEPQNVFSLAKDSWIELYNTQNQAVDLHEAHMQISLDGGVSSTVLPFGSSIAANKFLIIFPLESPPITSPANWNVVLSINGTIIDQATIPSLQPDQSYARVPDGSSLWLSCGSPTIDTSNNACDQPVTPTPARTPTPTKTPTSTVTALPSATLTPGVTLTPTVSAGTTASATGGSPDQPGSSGTQPAWGQIQLPTDPVSTPDLSTTAGSSPLLLTQPRNSTTGQNNSTNTGLVILLVSLALALLAGLAGWWKFWRKT